LPTSSWRNAFGEPAAEVREFAQVPDRYTRLTAGVQRYADERICVVQGSTWASIAGIRVATAEVPGLVAEVRALVDPAKRASWWIDPDSEPRDLRERLLALGLREPADGHDVVHALACVEEPAAGPSDVAVRPVESFEEQLVAVELAWDAFAIPEDRRAQQRPHLRSEFESAQRSGVPLTFLATIDGRPAGTASSIPSERGVFLVGGAVSEWARRRGVYRALVRARWHDAVARGTPALVVGALPDTSYPILKRLGFVDICPIRRLEDAR
jgi:hypothetical protein